MKSFEKLDGQRRADRAPHQSHLLSRTVCDNGFGGRAITMTSDERLNWEPWQEEYRHGAFYLFPPPEIALVVNELRQRYDPAFCGHL